MNKNFNPLVSIIIPIYNGSNYMREAIDSAIAQTYENIEIIVVNDGSTDNTEEIAKSYGDKIQYYKKENEGVATALNLAIKKSNGEYISWLSHDDVYFFSKIEKQISFLNINNEKKVILYSDWYIMDANGKYIFAVEHLEKHERKKLNNSFYPLLKGLVHGCTLLIPREAFDKVAFFDTMLKTTQDYDLWFKLFQVYPIRHMSEKLIKSRKHDKQGSRTIEESALEASILWIKMAEMLSDSDRMYISGNSLSFYKELRNIMIESNYNQATDYFEKRIERIENK